MELMIVLVVHFLTTSRRGSLVGAPVKCCLGNTQCVDVEPVAYSVFWFVAGPWIRQ